MLSVAVVDDEAPVREELVGMVERYAAESGERLRVRALADGSELLAVPDEFDIILLDIEMEGTDGMRAARKLRSAGVGAQIVFVTNMAQYAVKGYEVSALDFIVKPVRYPTFAFKFSRAVAAARRRQRSKVQITCKGTVYQLRVADIRYVEVSRHRLIYHTAEGVLETWGSMKAAREQLEPQGFALCSASFLVNLESVTSLTRDTVTVGGDELRVSRGRRQEFFDALTQAGGV